MSSVKKEYPACPHCGGVTVLHSKNKCGNQRYRCTKEGCKKTFVFPKVIRKIKNPPCPKCGQSGEVVKKGFTSDRELKGKQKREYVENERQRYLCKKCGSFIEGVKSKATLEHERSEALNALLGAMSKAYEIKDITTGDYHYEELLYRDKICKQFNISRKTLNKIYREYQEKHPEKYANKDTILAINERIAERSYTANNRNPVGSDTKISVIGYGIEKSEEDKS